MALTQPIGLNEPDAPPSGDDRVTPAMAQYIEIKAANPDCLLFYRMGDFYEMFFEDAEIASRALGIVLTKRGKYLGRDVPLCGVPVDPRRRISAQTDRARPPRRGVRAARRPGGSEKARLEKRRAPRRGAPRHRRYADRGHAARRAAQQLPAGDRAGASIRRRCALCARLARYVDRRIPHHRMRPRLSPAEIARLEPGEVIVSDALYADADLDAAVALAAGGDAARPRCLRRRHRRAAAHLVLSPSRPAKPSAHCRGWSWPRRRPASPMSNARSLAAARRCRRRCARASVPPWPSIRRPAPISN